MATIPSEFLCPITYDIMKNPVVGSDGHTYEEEEIRRHLIASMYSPMTRAYMDVSSLRPNYALKSQIERYLTTMPAPVAPKPFRSEPLTVAATSCVHEGTETVSITLTPPAVGMRQPIVMFIALDNSGSMGELAAADTNETGGLAFTRMDLCKHTIRTVAAMLNDDDMLSIVTFSTTARTVLRPTHMTADGKSRMEMALAVVKPDSQTNIWAGLEMVNRMAAAPELATSHRVAVLLTDGLPNVNPPRGIVPTYQAAVKSCRLSTFGFGYNLDSKLLAELATVGGGSFGFIPDYSMVATVFINWAATALATATTTSPLTLVHADGSQTKLPGETVQYGQPRTVLYKSRVPVKTVHVDNATIEVAAAPLTPAQATRSDIMNAIHVCIQSDGDTNLFPAVYGRYSMSDDAAVKEMLRDINPARGDAEGQVHMAPRYYQKWGKHYLRAYLKAQEQEQCMNFKDYGLQMYGGDLFHALQTEGETAFAALPALEPTGHTTAQYGGGAATGGGGAVPMAPAAPVNMQQMFYNAQGGCFHGDSQVRMADESRKSVAQLRRGDMVWTPYGIVAVRALVVCTMTEPIRAMCWFGGLGITPWHPIRVNNEWRFPIDIVQPEEVTLNTVYNIVLYKGHVLDVNGMLCVTLGHNFQEAVVKHAFFGTERVIEDLSPCKGWDDGLPTFANLRARRNVETGTIEGWYDDV